MLGPIRSAGRLALVFAFVSASAHGVSRIAPADSFDIYTAGIRIAVLTVTERGGSRSYTIRRKDLASNQWRAPVTAGEREAARDTAFLPVWGPLKHLIPLMPSVRDIRWSSLRAVGMPDPNTIYVRHNELHRRTAWTAA